MLIVDNLPPIQFGKWKKSTAFEHFYCDVKLGNYAKYRLFLQSCYQKPHILLVIPCRDGEQTNINFSEKAKYGKKELSTYDFLHNKYTIVQEMSKIYLRTVGV